MLEVHLLSDGCDHLLCGTYSGENRTGYLFRRIYYQRPYGCLCVDYDVCGGKRNDWKRRSSAGSGGSHEKVRRMRRAERHIWNNEYKVLIGNQKRTDSIEIMTGQGTIPCFCFPERSLYEFIYVRKNWDIGLNNIKQENKLENKAFILKRRYQVGGRRKDINNSVLFSESCRL